MDPPSLTSNAWLLSLGLAFFLFSISTLISSKKQREAVLTRIRLGRKRDSVSSTPPRSVSPENAGASSASEKAAPTPAQDLFDSFPPSRHSALLELAEHPSSSNKRLFIGPEPSPETIKTHFLSTIESPEVKDDCPKYTVTGFSAAEIKSLGNFPAYDILSGVPLPAPYEDFDYKKARPRPYRPFRWAYHQTMSLTKMEPDWWLEIENTYTSRVVERVKLYETYGKMVLDHLPGTELACKELMEMALQFYCARYPTLFSLSEDYTLFHNKILNSTTDLRTTSPLRVLLHNVPEDFAIVLRSPLDGKYYFRAGVICSSLGWNVSTKIGMCLEQIHAPIPDYKAKMSFSMDRFFSKMAVNSPIQRGSWGLEVGSPLFMPPGHPHEKLREVQQPDLQISDCNLRVDWQTLRRLPLSGAIVFNFKAIFTPVPEFRDEPYVPALLLKILKEGKRNLMDYKGTWHVEHMCIPELEKYAAEQVAKGWVRPENEGEEQWRECTLAESPYFPTWEEKWRRQQGF